MSSLAFKSYKVNLGLAGAISLLIIIVVFVSSIWPKQEDLFIELGLLDKDKTADSFFTNANSTINVGEQNNWFFYVHNHMKETQNISIRVKILNSTNKLPDNQENLPSPATFILDIPFKLSDNATAIIPFSWNIIEIETQKDATVIRHLIANEEIIAVDVTDSSNSFRIVFELWVQDKFSQEYKFGWSHNGGYSSASIYLWFRVD